jgi:multiple sugar transport system permease protein
MAQIALTAPTTRPERSRGARLMESRGFLGALFMLPAAAILLFFLTYPLGLGVWLGFTDTRLNRPGEFIGYENYESLLGDPIFLLSVFNTILYTAVASVLKFGLGLWLALILNEHLPFKAFFRRSCSCPGSCRQSCPPSRSGGFSMPSSRSSLGAC